MNTKRVIGSCIDQLKEMLGDPNNELSSEQRSRLKKGIRDLKRLQRAKRLTYAEVFDVASRIAEASLELLRPGLSE